MAPSPTIRRLLKETKELSEASSNPNPAFYAAPVSDSDLHEWHFTLLGPPAPSSYAGGLYHGRISLPPAYPMKPPNFRFLTASGRFEVNREICLSISGFHEETWQPAWGIRTALTALRSFMAEPGTAGQVGGLESSEEVRKNLARVSRKWNCTTCRQTNEERMKQWWKVCSERGIKVEEEHMAIEALPEGLSVEARDTNQRQEQEKEDEQTAKEQTSSAAVASTSNPSDTAIPIQSSDSPSISRSETTEPQLPSNSNINISTGMLQRQQISAGPASPQSTHSTSISSPRQSSSIAIHSIPTTARRPEEQPTITIDRAITAVFLALCVMVLKKIFYPASTSGFSYDELNLMRE